MKRKINKDTTRMIIEVKHHHRDFVEAEAEKMERPSMSKVWRNLADAEINRRKKKQAKVRKVEKSSS